jgi:hypothetical protein
MTEPMVRAPFHALGRDLFFDLYCCCPHPLFVGTECESIIKNSVKLSGYADDYFMRNSHE